MTFRGLRGLVATLLLCAVAASCAGTRSYQATPDNNLRFTTKVESGSLMSSVRASAHIHSIDGNCRTNYEGTIRLEKETYVTGVDVNRPSYLVLSFDSSSFLSNSRSSINYATILMPRRGHDYKIAVIYVDDTYNAIIHEVNRGNGRQRELQQMPLDTCRTLQAGRTKGAGKR